MKNFIKKATLSLILSAILVVSGTSLIAKANDSVTIDISKLYADGSETITIKEDGYTIGDEFYKHSGSYVFTGTWEGDIKPNKNDSSINEENLIQTSLITVAKDVDANITFDNLTIIVNDNSYFSKENPFRIAQDSCGDVTITLKGHNEIKCMSNNAYLAAIQKSSYSNNTGSLTIQCENANQKGHECDENCGSLDVSSKSAPAIGGSSEYIHYDQGEIGASNFVNFYIKGGNINASTSKDGSAAIGTGDSAFSFFISEDGQVISSKDNVITTINIEGGNINTDTDANFGVGIGSGLCEDNHETEINISGGNIHANGKSGIHETRGEYSGPAIGTASLRLEDFYKNSRINITGGEIITQNLQDEEYLAMRRVNLLAHNINIDGGIIGIEENTKYPEENCYRIRTYSLNINGGVLDIKDKNIFADNITSSKDGNGVLIYGSTTANKDAFKGILIDNEGNGLLTNDSVTPTNSFTVPNGRTLELNEGQSLYIKDGVKLTNEGTINNNGEIISLLGSSYEGTQPENNKVQYEIAFPQKEEQKGYSIEYKGNKYIPYGENITFTLTLEDGYHKGDDFKVTANGKDISENNNGQYTYNVTTASTINVQGVEKESSENTPTIIFGANSKWSKGDGDLTFKSSADFKDFIKVLVDGKELKEDNYTVKEGSTVVTLKSSYLETLSEGEHTLEIVSKTGSAKTTFTILSNNQTVTPETSDNNNLILWLSILSVSSLALISFYTYIRKFNN